VEFRNAVALADDAVGLEDILDKDFDAHLRTLSAMDNGGYDPPKYRELLAAYRAKDPALDERRSQAKARTFKPLFGGEYGTPEEMIYYAYFKDRYKAIAEWQRRNVRTVCNTGKLECVGGLTLTFHVGTNKWGTPIHARTGKQLTPSVCNYPVQFFSTVCVAVPSILALDAKVEALTQIKVHDPTLGPPVILAGTTHDSAFGYVRRDWVEWLRNAVDKSFIDDCYATIKSRFNFDYKIPLGVELKVGRHLGDSSILHYKASRRPGDPKQ
jgi:hypothetical protein